ncbi:hypothetical protein [Haloarcula saliterrae]|nr:hypothetical protein [Haloarcula sp. S1CR25-12]
MVETSEAKQVTRAASSLLYPEGEFGIAANLESSRGCAAATRRQ